MMDTEKDAEKLGYKFGQSNWKKNDTIHFLVCHRNSLRENNGLSDRLGAH